MASLSPVCLQHTGIYRGLYTIPCQQNSPDTQAPDPSLLLLLPLSFFQGLSNLLYAFDEGSMCVSNVCSSDSRVKGPQLLRVVRVLPRVSLYVCVGCALD